MLLLVGFCLNDRLVMRVNCLGEAHEFLTALEALAELEELDRDGVVDLEGSGVVAQRVEDDLAHVDVESQSGEDLVLLVDEVHLAVSQNVEFFRSGIVLLDHAHFGGELLFVVEIGDDRFEGFSCLFVFEVFQEILVLFEKVAEAGLEERVGEVLGDVAEVADTVFERAGISVLDADVNNLFHELAEHLVVGLVSVVL
jgi:hypothetical protein